MNFLKIFDAAKEILDKANKFVKYIDENKDLIKSVVNHAKEYFDDAKDYLKKVKDTIGDETQVEPEQEILREEKQQETEKIQSLPEPKKVPVYDPKRKQKKTETNNDVW